MASKPHSTQEAFDAIAAALAAGEASYLKGGLAQDFSLFNKAHALLAGLEEQLEVANGLDEKHVAQRDLLDDALRDILDIIEGWTPKMDCEVRLGRIGAYATEALKAAKAVSTPATSSEAVGTPSPVDGLVSARPAPAASDPASRLHNLTTDDSQNEPPGLETDDDFDI